MSRERYIPVTLSILVLIALFLTHYIDYLLFHSLAEMFSIVIAFLVFVISWNSRHIVTSGYFLFLGTAYLSVGFFGLMYILTYSGIPVFTDAGINLSSQLWITARYIEALSLFASLFWLRRKIRPGLILLVYTILILGILLFIFIFDIFPVCYSEDMGFTAFERISEFVIFGVLLLALCMIILRRHLLDITVFRFMSIAITLTILSMGAYLCYTSCGLLNVTGHFFKLFAFYAIYAALIKTGFEQPFALMFRDLKENRDLLQQSSEKLQNIFDSMTDGIIICNITGAVIDVNKRLLEIFHIGSKEEILGKKAINIFREQDRKRAWKNFLKRFQGEQIGTVHYQLCAQDGIIVETEVNTSITHNASGQPSGILLVIRDITDRICMEQEQREMEQKAQTASRLAALGEMASGIAHEINNPLTAVIGYADLLMRRNLPHAIKTDIATIHEAAERVAAIVHRMLLFARQQKPEHRIIHINELVDSTLQLAAYSLQGNKIQVLSQLQDNLPATMADGSQLQQVFLNIILNAEYAMSTYRGSGTLKIRTAAQDDQITVTFSDDGPGIKPEHLDRIFSPFFTTKEVGEGTGLGLSICHGIIREHKGTIAVKSERGKGATFVVTLPVIDKLPDAQVKEEAIPESPVEDVALLVIDDEPMVRSFMYDLFLTEGYRATVCASAEEAMAELTQNQYDLILLDIKLPGINGIEFYSRLEESDIGLSKKIIFITGDVMSKGSQEFIDSHGVPCITKPFHNTDELLNRIKRFLKQHV